MRTKHSFRKADAILCDDWHLREDQPRCRTDDFTRAQWRKVDFIAGLQQKHDCHVLHAGDLLNHWRSSPYLLSMIMWHLPRNFHTVYGQHDLPFHNLDLAHKSGVYTLMRSGHLIIGPGCSFGQYPKPGDVLVLGKRRARRVLIWHKLTWIKKPPWPGCIDPTAQELLLRYPQYDLIVTGDHHASFVYELEGRILVNAGNLSRQTADQIDYEPAVYLYYAEDNSVERVPLPIESGVITREYLSEKKDRDIRIEAFITSLSRDFDAGMSFEENLKLFQQQNNIRQSVMQIILQAIGDIECG